MTVTSDSGNSGLNACVALVYPEYNRRYLVCMAQQEAYFFNLEDFFEPHHPGNISSLPFTDPLRSTVAVAWNNGKEVPRWGVADKQKMSPSTTARCYCCH